MGSDPARSRELLKTAVPHYEAARNRFFAHAARAPCEAGRVARIAVSSPATTRLISPDTRCTPTGGRLGLNT